MIETVLIGCIFIVIIYLWKYKRPNNFPPGPKPIPFLGNIFQMPAGHLFPTVEEWSKKYGPIIGINLISQLVVIVTGVDNVLAALRQDEFQSRPDNYAIRDRSFGKCLGIFFSSGKQWASSRKFVVKHLRGHNKTENENIILNEITLLMETIKDGSTIQGAGLFGVSAVNVIWTIIANKRIDHNNEKSSKFLNNLGQFFRQGNPSGGDIVNIVPLIRFLSPKYNFSQIVIKETQNYIKEVIEEHREILDPNNPRDLIDHYLVEMDHNKSNPNSLFTEEDLIMVGLDLFTAGSQSVSNSIEFVLLYMVLYPEIQAKMQEELDQVLGRGRKPTLDDRSKLHYTMAVLSEVERNNMIAPTNVPHKCTKDTTFKDYFIPKETIVSINLWSLGRDPQYWNNPDKFDPERFLSAEGKYNKSPILNIFGLGQRTCVGEALARNLTFLSVTTFFEKFSISLPREKPRPSTLALPGFTSAPQPFKITIKSRY